MRREDQPARMPSCSNCSALLLSELEVRWAFYNLESCTHTHLQLFPEHLFHVHKLEQVVQHWEASLSAITVIPIECVLWPGRPMARISSQQGKIKPLRYGKLSLEII